MKQKRQEARVFELSGNYPNRVSYQRIGKFTHLHQMKTYSMIECAGHVHLLCF